MLGGFLNALMLSATRKYLELEFGPGRYPDPIHVFVQFLNIVPPGQVIITCHILRTSSRQCVVRVELSRLVSAAEVQSTTVAIVTYGDLSKEKGLSQDAEAALSLSTPLPNRDTECVPIDDPVVDATPVTRKLHWIAPQGANGLWGHRLGGHQREVWLSPRDGSKWSSIFHLAMLADMVGQHHNQPLHSLPATNDQQPLQPPATHEQGFYTRYALSTLCLSVEFKRNPHPDTQWVMTRSNSTKVFNGRYDVNLQILDESGELLALSHHVVYIVPLKPLLKGAKI